MKVGVFIPNWIGDACMVTPALRGLRGALDRHDLRQFSEMPLSEGSEVANQLIAICRPGPARLLANEPYIDRILTYKPRAKRPILGRRALVDQLRKERLDSILLFTNSWSGALMAWLSGATKRYGYKRNLRSWMLTHPHPAPCEGKWPRRRWQPISAIDYYTALVEAAFSIQIEDRRMQLAIDPLLVNDARRRLMQAGLLSGTCKLIVINNNAASANSRLMLESQLIETCMELLRQPGYRVLLHCGPNEREQPARVTRSINDPRVASMSDWGDLPMSMSTAVFSMADVVITTDSGARHLAVAADRPVITLHGSTDARWTMTYNIPERHLEPTVECFPCWRTECRWKDPTLHMACMKQHTPSRIREAVREILSSSKNPLGLKSYES